jgi:hypothetical protein
MMLLKGWKPLKPARGGPDISHLFFADDLVFWGEATDKQAEAMASIMRRFCGTAGQEVNLAKSKMYVSPNVPRQRARTLSAHGSIPLTTDLGRYLGVPLLHSRVTKERLFLIYIMDRVRNKLSGWKATHLSMAGRATLVQSVIATIPSYAMQTTRIPISVCDALDRCNRRFSR